jgi:signal transduction histidine kinase
MKDDSIYILLIEDNPGDARLVKEMLAEGDPSSFRLSHVERLAEGIAQLKEDDFQVVLLDLSLPDGQGLDTVIRICTQIPHVPVLVFTGCNDETLAIRAVQVGAQDYLVKGQMDHHLLKRSIRYALERKRAEERMRALEERLRHSQKMEAIGTLAGGIAHDFNNILSGLLGYAELARLETSLGSRINRNLEELLRVGARAKDLVKQILAFSRRTFQEKKPIHVEPLVQEAVKLLRSSLPTTIEIRLDIKEDSGIIDADPTQIHQVLLNLCTNSYHAMEETGGLLTIGLSPIHLDAYAAGQHPDLQQGPYVRLTVSDTGVGMAPEILERVFDPYFTTKEAGKGTGLGLAVVHGIVHSHGGAIKVYSEPGKGTTFHVYFPRVETSFEGTSLGLTEEPVPLGRGEHILLIDDEPALVEIGKQMLEHLGYQVTVRTSSVEALGLFSSQPSRFDLVITDMTMAHMTGEKLAEEMLRIRPNLPIILCTGFSEHISEAKAKALGIREFLMKPLTLKDLARAVRRNLALQVDES